ncbi:hypothetical protein, partial [Rhodococcus sp. T7]|uniref:hypothetical protein n=1 Tax=Rhodococcus sp. T7 TaxID=627444 RepID=UPI001F2065C6
RHDLHPPRAHTIAQNLVTGSRSAPLPAQYRRQIDRRELSSHTGQQATPEPLASAGVQQRLTSTSVAAPGWQPVRAGSLDP